MQATVVTPAILSAHIALLNSGKIDFSQVELNCRADLVRFEGYSVEQAASMEEGDVYRILDGETYEDEWGPNIYGLRCKCGSKDVKIQFINGYPGRYGSSEDGYICKCGCGSEFFVHECAIDAIMEHSEEYA